MNGRRTAEQMRIVIRARQTPLTELSERIETLYIAGRLTTEERAGLIELMHSEASAGAEMGDYREMYRALAEKYNGLEARVRALEAQDGGGDSGTEGGYPAWRAWDGVSGEYPKGAVVVHNGILWESVYDGQNVWEPGAHGVDERYWVEIGLNEPEEEERREEDP